MSSVWFTSDLHFGHEAVIRFCNRPFASIDEMDRRLAERWNDTIRPKDRVYVLGDVSFHPPAKGVPLLQKLHGDKILVLGNHDKYSVTQYISAGFLSVAEEMVINLAGQRVRLSHYPYWDDSSDDPHDQRYPERRPKRLHPTDKLLCGHVHGRWKVKGTSINVGVDAWNYGPVSQGAIERIWANAGKSTPEVEKAP